MSGLMASSNFPSPGRHLYEEQGLSGWQGEVGSPTLPFGLHGNQACHVLQRV